jgi:plastocyanin
MQFARLNHLAAFVAVVGAVACGGNGGGTAPCTPGPATQLLKTDGDQQAWYFSNPLPKPYTVTVRDANNCAVPGASVAWSSTTGGGTFSSNPSTTSPSGIATTTHTLGTAMTYVVRATVAGVTQTQDFSATASAPPTSGAVDVGDDFFRETSLVVQAGGTVTWTWSGAHPHSVTFNGGADSGTKTAGTFQQTFTNTGTFTYHCVVHGNMNGTVTVVH